MNKFKLTSLVAAASLFSFSAAPVMASPFPASGSVTGTVTFQQSMTIDCTFNATYSVSGSDVVITGMTFSPPVSAYCGTAVMPNAGPWVIVGAAGHPSDNVVVTGVGATTVQGGACAGNIQAELLDEGSGHVLYIENQTVPGAPADCTVILAELIFS